MTEQPDPRVISESVIGIELEDAQCRVLADIMTVCRVADGDVLVAEGDSNDSLHLLAAGRLRVESGAAGRPVVLYSLKPGEVAGTRAFIDRTTRRATLRAVGDATVYALDPGAFEQLLEAHPWIVYEVMRAIFRVTHTNLMRADVESEELKNYFLKQHGRY